MKLLSSLRSRIFLATALLSLLSIGTAIYVVTVRVTREVENSLRREIATTSTLVEQFRTTRSQNFAMMARLVAGQAPAWLRPVAMPGESGLLVWEVAGN